MFYDVLKKLEIPPLAVLRQKKRLETFGLVETPPLWKKLIFEQHTLC